MNPDGTITDQNARSTQALNQYARPVTPVGATATATPAVGVTTRMGAATIARSSGRARSDRLSAGPATTRLTAPTARWTELTSSLRSASVS